ncbi:hypothetical protein [Nocardia gipuzkoensis]
MADPINYQWCLCGTVLDAERGTVQTSYGNLGYLIDEGRLSIATEKLDQAIECDLCLSAVYARDQELFTCIKLSRPLLDRRSCSTRPPTQRRSSAITLPLPWTGR